ncbi:delta-lactam-biosynthetic de-N-acetylase [Aquibacillus sp. 3ASR75-11]|uniref:Delta-lactam-biosynthetic de-N-acetylase n=1 Tax=Terrihalobacillus insolitus TaxID=2950438 RepID=A0A9X3WW78_9BACI|nr:delta-lactam-biosynthetic de-N-acetylase [Terrihalobacillus insolitus]MDC3413458.1 delta-lactam-biosynthetic de-N-acetylase [Terrihalobacillus insolitus]MDC3425251.1 delta-lactam-biosynthetic de-N-acetylase [Terrihalobacillus insolitus]
MKNIIVNLIIMSMFMFLISPNFVYGESNKTYGWGFNKKDNNEPPEVGKYKQILSKYNGIYIDDSGDKVVYLTFDNGYEAGHTSKILDVLKKKKVPATFFVTGHYVKSQPELIKRMVKEGHIIGNHTYRHPENLTSVSKQRIEKELRKLEDAVADISEQKTMKYLRPPKGVFSERTLSITQDLGYMNVFWSLALVDWNKGKEQGWQQAYKKVIKQMHPGAVILLHTVSKDNADALEHLIDELRKRGYTFQSLDDLMMKNMVPRSILGL